MLLKLFGAPLVEASGQPVTGRAVQGRRLALLALLARSGRMTRDKVIALLWPESTTERARHLLSDTVYIIRGALGENVIRSVGDELVLDADAITSDVAAFERLLDEGQLEAAAERFTGQLLDGFHLSEALEFERWLDGERARTGQRYAAALEALAEQSEGRADFAGAVGWWRKLAAHSPYSGRVALRLMRALEAVGERAGALQHARVHEALLREEFAAAPDPEVTASAERLRLEPSAGSSSEPTNRWLDRLAAARTPPPAGTTAAPPVEKPRSRIHISAAVLLIVLATGLYWIRESRVPVQPSSTSSVAVLPFVNMSGDPEEEYFSDGLTEELITALSQLPSLRVVARTSVFTFKGEHRDIREIGRALRVAAVVEGSVRREADRVRVTVQLINAADGFHIWSATYEERHMADIFDVQRDISLRVADALEAELTSRDRERLARRPTADPDAHLLYLKGRYFLTRRTGGSLATAIEYFERAVAADPQYAEAHAGLASAYASVGVHGYVSAAEGRERMERAARRAIEIDADLAEARTALAGYHHLYEWDFASAESQFRRAIDLDPSFPTAHTWYGYLFESLGRFDEAVAQHRISLELDPLSAYAYSALGFALFLAGQPDLALEHIEQALELDATNWMAHSQLGQISESIGQLDVAVTAYESAVAHSGAATKPRAALARVWALSGREDEARGTLADLVEDAKGAGQHAPVVATVFLALRDADAAMAWLESAYVERHPDLLRIPADPRFGALRGDPRFPDLLERIGLPR